MFPSLTYSRLPGTSARGSFGTTTMLEGVGVRIGPSGPGPPVLGSEPPNSARVITPISTSPMPDSAGASSTGGRGPPVGRQARGARGCGLLRVTWGSRADYRGGANGARRQPDGVPSARRGPDGRSGSDGDGRRLEDRAGFRVVAGRRRIPD